MKAYPVHSAVLESNTDQLNFLIASNADLNELDEQGQSPLHWAVFRGDIEAVETLLGAGANPNVFATDGVTPKWRAVDFGLDEIEELLSKFGGKVLTDECYDKVMFSALGEVFGQEPPMDENGKTDKE